MISEIEGANQRIKEIKAERDEARALAEHYKKALENFATLGICCDLHPTDGHRRDWQWWTQYLKDAHDDVRERAQRALKGGQGES